MNSNLAFNRELQMPFNICKDRNRVRNTVFYGRVSTEHANSARTVRLF